MLWLAEHYRGTCKEDDPYRGFHSKSNLHLDASRLFTTKLMVKMMSWSFGKQNWKAALSTSSSEVGNPQTVPWLRGPVVLKILRDKYGVPIVLPDLRDAFIANVRSLYAPATSSRLLANRVHAQNCGVRLDDYMRSWSLLWQAEASKRTANPDFVRTSHVGRRRRLVRHSLS